MSDVVQTLPEILFVDDELTAIKYFQRAVESLAGVITATSVAEAKTLLDAHADSLLVIVSDQRMPGAYGNELLEYAKQAYPAKVRILTTAYSELSDTIQAVNQGQIHRYLQKPWDIATLRMELKQALSLARLQRDHDLLRREKLQVQQKQLIANRIVDLYVTLQGLAATTPGAMLEWLLSLTQQVGVQPLAPSWHAQNYTDWLAQEAARSGHFVQQISAELQALQQKNLPTTPVELQQALAAFFPNHFEVTDNHIKIRTPAALVVFFTQTTDIAPTLEEARWVAALVYLSRLGLDCQLSAQPSGYSWSITTAAAPWPAERLAIWLEQFI
ncbi:response regulator [Parvibium lacunae]|uniref:Response regulator n=1 Tax=Parvibium lacunae TaxID=1888893 RepID=A0A368L4B6_9BURK|nr:response regulator [Parvibium lacunae]RCS58414.1 response regulator [Parvibium lacunae]